MSDNPYVRNYGKSPYLKCKHGEIMNPPIGGEYSINFTSLGNIPGDGSMIVGAKEITSIENGRGLLRIHDIFPSSYEEGSLVNIACNDEGGLVKRSVPTEEIVWR